MNPRDMYNPAHIMISLVICVSYRYECVTVTINNSLAYSVESSAIVAKSEEQNTARSLHYRTQEIALEVRLPIQACQSLHNRRLMIVTVIYFPLPNISTEPFVSMSIK